MCIKVRLRVYSLNHFMMLSVQKRLISKGTIEIIQVYLKCKIQISQKLYNNRSKQK